MTKYTAHLSVALIMAFAAGVVALPTFVVWTSTETWPLLPLIGMPALVFILAGGAAWFAMHARKDDDTIHWARRVDPAKARRQFEERTRWTRAR